MKETTSLPQTISSDEGYVLNLNLLRDGDVILESGYKPHSELIKIKTGSRYSHAMIFLGRTIFEATKNGTVFTRVPNRFHVKSSDDLKIIRLKEPISESSLNNMETYARTQIATSYSVPEAIRSSREKKPKKKKEKGQFCSRLVAEILNAGGIHSVDNIHYCTPADLEKLEDSGLFSVVEGAVKKASPEEMKHASSGEMHPKHQKATVEWTKKAKKLLKPYGNNIQNINEILQALLDSRNLKLDKIIASSMIESGYADDYKDDRIANPYRYDTAEFSRLFSEGLISIDAEIDKEISIFKLQMTNIKSSKSNLDSTLGMYKTIKLEYEICKGILSAIKDRMDVLLAVCREHKVSSPNVDYALHMSQVISYELR